MLIGDRVREVLVVHLGLDRGRMVGPALLDDDLGLDSLSLTEALLALEDELTISIPDSVQSQLRTFDDLLAVVAPQVDPGSGRSTPAGVGSSRQLPVG